MSLTAVALIAASVLLHVMWNAVAKNRPTFAFFFFGNLIGAAALSPVVFVHRHVLADLPAAVWWLLAGAGIAQIVYCITLARAYREEALSVVYPIVRSLGPAFVVVGSYALGRGTAISWDCVLAIALIFAGSVGLASSNLRTLGRKSLPSLGIIFSIVSALATTAYTLIDDAGIHRVVESGALESLGNSPLRAGLLYAAFESWATALGMGRFMLRTAAHRQAIREYASSVSLRDATMMGIGSNAAYILVLIAMLYARVVSYVAGFRQLSVPLAAAVGVTWLGEPLGARKAVALSLMLGGLLLIASA